MITTDFRVPFLLFQKRTELHFLSKAIVHFSPRRLGPFMSELGLTKKGDTHVSAHGGFIRLKAPPPMGWGPGARRRGAGRQTSAPHPPGSAAACLGRRGAWPSRTWASCGWGGRGLLSKGQTTGFDQSTCILHTTRINNPMHIKHTHTHMAERPMGPLGVRHSPLGRGGRQSGFGSHFFLGFRSCGTSRGTREPPCFRLTFVGFQEGMGFLVRNRVRLRLANRLEIRSLSRKLFRLLFA